MKKDNILLEMARTFDFSNRKRNAVLVVSIAFSIMSLFFLLSIVKGRAATDDIKRIRENGNAASFIVENVSEEQLQKLYELSYVDDVVVVRNFGDCFTDNKKSATCAFVGVNEFQRIYLPAYDEVEGTYPINFNEVMVSKKVLKKMGIEEPVIGMEIPLDIIPYDWLRGDKEDINMTFRLSGYYIDYIQDMDKMPSVFFSQSFVKNQSFTSFIDVALIKSSNFWLNRERIESRFHADISLEKNQSFSVINGGIAETIFNIAGSSVFAFVGALLLLLSINICIYIIFSISINKDRRQYGLLKVIGAEPEQIGKIFLFQVLKITLSGGFWGVILSVLSVGFLLPWLLEKMYLAGYGSIRYEELFSWRLLLGAVLLSSGGGICAFNTCIRCVMKLSPIECLKYEEKITVPNKKNVHSKGAGLAGVAWRNFTRNRAKMIIIISSLFVGIEIFLLSVMVSEGLDQTHKIQQAPDFEVGVTKEAVEHYIQLNEGCDLESLQGHPLISEELILTISEKTGLDKNNFNQCIGGFGTFSYNSEALKPRINSMAYDKEIITGLTVQVVSETWIDKLDTYIEKQDLAIDLDTLRSGNGFILLHNHELSKHQQVGVLEKVVGQKLYGILFEDGGNSFQLTCCGYLDITKNGFPKLDMPWQGKNLVYIIVSNKAIEQLGMKPVVYNISFDVNDDEEVLIKNIIKDIVLDANQKAEFSNTYYYTATSDKLIQEQNYIWAVRIIMSGFSCILLSFVFVSYYSILLSGYNSRIKEFGIMRSIGMTIYQVKQLLVLESIIYLIVVVVLVLTLGSIIMGIIATLIYHQISYFTFQYPVIPMLLTICIMFFISWLAPVLFVDSKFKEKV